MVGSGYVGSTGLLLTTYPSWILTPFRKLMTYLQLWQVVNHLVNLISAMHICSLYLMRNTESYHFKYTKRIFSVQMSSLWCFICPCHIQRTMDSLLQGIPQTCVYLGNILISGTTVEKHVKNLDEVYCRLQTASLRFKSSKYLFMTPSVGYLYVLLTLLDYILERQK